MAQYMGTNLAVSSLIDTGDLQALKNGAVKESEHLAVTRTNQFEGLVACATITVDGKVIIEAGRLDDVESLHHREARAVNDGEVLIGEGFTDGPSGFKVGGGHRLDPDASAPDLIPKSLRYITAKAAVEQEPGLDQDVIGGDVVPRARKD